MSIFYYFIILVDFLSIHSNGTTMTDVTDNVKSWFFTFYDVNSSKTCKISNYEIKNYEINLENKYKDFSTEEAPRPTKLTSLWSMTKYTNIYSMSTLLIAAIFPLSFGCELRYFIISFTCILVGRES